MSAAASSVLRCRQVMQRTEMDVQQQHRRGLGSGFTGTASLQ
jgi:hypothetical protein